MEGALVKVLQDTRPEKHQSCLGEEELMLKNWNKNSRHFWLTVAVKTTFTNKVEADGVRGPSIRTRELPWYVRAGSGFPLVAVQTARQTHNDTFGGETKSAPLPWHRHGNCWAVLDLGRCHISERVVIPLSIVGRQHCESLSVGICLRVGADSPLQRAALPLLQQQIQELETPPADEDNQQWNDVKCRNKWNGIPYFPDYN